MKEKCVKVCLYSYLTYIYKQGIYVKQQGMLVKHVCPQMTVFSIYNTHRIKENIKVSNKTK